MFKISYMAISTGLLSMIVASVFFYFGIRSMFTYVLFGTGFLLIGIGLLLGLARMMSDDND